MKSAREMQTTTTETKEACGKAGESPTLRNPILPTPWPSLRLNLRAATRFALGCGLATQMAFATTARAQVAENLVVEGVPAIPPELKASVSRYLEFRSASFQSWHPTRREMLISTRFADSAQVFLVRQPLGQRKQLTFQSEPVAGAAFQPKTGECFVFSQDAGGGEFYQL